MIMENNNKQPMILYADRPSRERIGHTLSSQILGCRWNPLSPLRLTQIGAPHPQP